MIGYKREDEERSDTCVEAITGIRVIAKGNNRLAAWSDGRINSGNFAQPEGWNTTSIHTYRLLLYSQVHWIARNYSA